LQYSKKLNALLVETNDSTKKDRHAEVDIKYSINLYDISENKIEKLSTERFFSPLWLEDGEKLIFFSFEPSSGIYEYDIANNKETKKKSYKRNPGLSLSPDKKYLLTKVFFLAPKEFKQLIEVISLEDGKKKRIDWEEQFDLDFDTEFPGDMILVE